MKVPHNVLIVVADGEKAKMFTNILDGHDINLKSLGDMTFEGMEHKGPSVLPPDVPDQEISEATHSKHIAERLYEKINSGEMDKLILIADPGTMGEIRPLLHDEVKKALLAEIPKTLTNSTLDSIEKILLAA